MFYQVDHSEILHSAQSVYLSDFYGSQNMEKLFPHTILTGLYKQDGMCLLHSIN